MKHMNLRISLALMSASILAVTGCSSPSAGPSTTPSPNITESVMVTPSESATGSGSSSPSASSDSSDDAIILSTAQTSLGEIIVGKDGMAVYYFTNDVKGSDTSKCTGQCIVNWPPVISESGNPKVKGITAEVDTIKFGEEQKHVTVNGMPVYYWIKDKAPGDVTGQGVQGVWYVIAPDGAMIKTPAPAQSSSKPNAMGATFSLASMSTPMKNGADDVVPEAPHAEGPSGSGRSGGSDDAPEAVEPPHVDFNDVPEVTDVAPVAPAVPVLPFEVENEVEVEHGVEVENEVEVEHGVEVENEVEVEHGVEVENEVEDGIGIGN